MDTAQFAYHLDFANHHANATKKDITELCHLVTKYGFHAAFVNPVHIKHAKETLCGKAKTGTAFCFPLGQEELETKLKSASLAVNAGADELDGVPDLSKFLENKDNEFLDEMKSIVDTVKSINEKTIVKFILETGYITDEKGNLDHDKLMRASLLVQQSKADYVKICSGMGPRGATLEDYETVRSAVGQSMKIKVAGGVTSFNQAKTFIDHGVTRIGTSKAVEIVNELSLVVSGNGILTSE